MQLGTSLLFGGDYSYGLYLYGFPIQQAVASAGNWIHHWYINFGIALPLAAGVAYFSWNYLKKPFLSRKALLVDTGDVARSFRDYVARCSNMMSPG
jgi:peptidoglycan/LPS O-acetylase OafA/YrhL